MKYIKYILLGMAAGLFYGISFINETSADAVGLYDIIFKLSFGEFLLCNSNAAYYDKIFLCLAPMLVFQIVSGTEIYRHFCLCGVYYFSRCSKRDKWLLRETVRLLCFSVINSFFIIFTFTIVVLFVFKSISVQTSTFLLAVYYVLIFSLWNFLFSYMINILAFKLKSDRAFFIAASSEVAMSLFYVMFQDSLYKIYDMDERAVFMIKADPLSSLFISWHSSVNKDINSFINIFDISFDLNFSLITVFLACAALFLLSLKIVNGVELIESNKESGE